MVNNQMAQPSNVAFGGADRKTLYITSSYGLFELPLQIAGYPY
jgi:gluconolactonase